MYKKNILSLLLILSMFSGKDMLCMNNTNNSYNQIRKAILNTKYRLEDDTSEIFDPSKLRADFNPNYVPTKKELVAEIKEIINDKDIIKKLLEDLEAKENRIYNIKDYDPSLKSIQNLIALTAEILPKIHKYTIPSAIRYYETETNKKQNKAPDIIISKLEKRKCTEKILLKRHFERIKRDFEKRQEFIKNKNNQPGYKSFNFNKIK